MEKQKSTKAILEALQPLFEKAYKEDLWFRSYYQDVWFSPDELKEHIAKDEFVWGPVNWELRDPLDHVAKLAARITEIQNRLDNFTHRVQRWNDRRQYGSSDNPDKR
jgi:hypothetical protein